MKLQGKKILVLGLANKQSVAWGVLEKIKKEGAQVGICFFHQSNEKRVRPLAEEIGADFFIEADVTMDRDLEKIGEKIKEEWGSFDGLVHCIAFSPADEFNKPIYECSKEGFFKTLDISAFSLLSLTKYLKEYFSHPFSILSMTYYGSKKVLPGYHIMGVAKAALETINRYLAAELGGSGVRVNCISAGPIKTLAAVGIPNFNSFLDNVSNHSPLKENITIEDVGNLASFLLSDEAKHITAQVHFVDSGISTIVR